MATTLNELKQDAETRRDENLLLSEAYSKTLSLLMPANLLLVVGAALLSLVAGASVLSDNGILTNPQAGILALISGAFTIIHSKMGCDQYQAECRKLLSFHRGMSADYSNIAMIDDVDEFRRQFSALNDQVSAALKSTTSLPYNFTTGAVRGGAKASDA
jgi:hypothetical protein